MSVKSIQCNDYYILMKIYRDSKNNSKKYFKKLMHALMRTCVQCREFSVTLGLRGNCYYVTYRNPYLDTDVLIQ